MSLEDSVGRILTERGLRIAVAESCTGGLISSRITDVSGSSNYFEAGLVTYSNRAKEAFLSVPTEILTEHGAVSRQVAEKMAEGVKRATGVDLGLAVTGIAGPTGGTPEKPVGTVHIALAVKDRTFVRDFQFTGDRLDIKRHTSEEALKVVLDYLEGRLT